MEGFGTSSHYHITNFSRVIGPFEQYHIVARNLFCGLPDNTLELTANTPNKRLPVSITSIHQILLKTGFAICSHIVKELFGNDPVTVRYIVFCPDFADDNLMPYNRRLVLDERRLTVVVFFFGSRIGNRRWNGQGR